MSERTIIHAIALAVYKAGKMYCKKKRPTANPLLANKYVLPGAIRFPNNSAMAINDVIGLILSNNVYPGDCLGHVTYDDEQNSKYIIDVYLCLPEGEPQFAQTVDEIEGIPIESFCSQDWLDCYRPVIEKFKMANKHLLPAPITKIYGYINAVGEYDPDVFCYCREEEAQYLQEPPENKIHYKR